jgi:hypothetical protein
MMPGLPPGGWSRVRGHTVAAPTEPSVQPGRMCS